MSDLQIIEVEPRGLHLPTTRPDGADPGKLQRQISQFGRSKVGMPPLQLIQGSDDYLVINDGVTRATRIAKVRPGITVPALIIGKTNRPVGHLPTVEDKLP